MRTLLKLILTLVALFSVALGVIRAQTFDANVLPELGLVPPGEDGCPVASWLGICPGHTTMLEATNRLRTHRWIRDLQADSHSASWGWSSRAPVWIDQTSRGSLYSPDGVTVNSIAFQTSLPLRLFFLEQEPELIIFWRDPPSPVTRHAAMTWSRTVALWTTIPCPVQYHSLTWALVVVKLDMDSAIPYMAMDSVIGFPFSDYSDLNTVNNAICSIG